MPTYRLDVAYLGTHFHGYARQRDVRTVQGELEDALFKMTGTVETQVAGRTDAGVHASGQVVSFSVEGALDTERLGRSLNRQLSPEIAVSGVSEVGADFDARFSATGRRYRYVVLNRDAPDPFRAATTWHVPMGLDVQSMRSACRHLVGEHDFASLCRRAGGTSTVRTVLWAEWGRVDDEVELSIAASAFCHQMVRSIVALAVEVGRGRVSPDAVPAILEATDRAAAKGAAPPHGLVLVEVGYPGEPLTTPGWIETP